MGLTWPTGWAASTVKVVSAVTLKVSANAHRARVAVVLTARSAGETRGAVGAGAVAAADDQVLHYERRVAQHLKHADARRAGDGHVVVAGGHQINITSDEQRARDGQGSIELAIDRERIGCI